MSLRRAHPPTATPRSPTRRAPLPAPPTDVTVVVRLYAWCIQPRHRRTTRRADVAHPHLAPTHLNNCVAAVVASRAGAARVGRVAETVRLKAEKRRCAAPRHRGRGDARARKSGVKSSWRQVQLTHLSSQAAAPAVGERYLSAPVNSGGTIVVVRAAALAVPTNSSFVVVG